VFIAAMVESMAFWIWGTNPQEEVWCADDTTESTQSINTKCAVQGFIVMYFNLSCMSWMVVLSHQMFSLVVLQRQIQNYDKWIYHFSGWGIPLLLSGVAIGYTNDIGFGPPAPYCYMRSSDTWLFFYGPHDDYDYYVYYLPLALMMTSALVMLSITIAKIVKHRKNILAERHGSLTIERAQTRMIVFSIGIFFCCAQGLAWKFVQTALNAPNKLQVDLAWLICKVKTELGMPHSDQCLQNMFPVVPNFGYTVFQTAVISSIGIFVFVCFGTDSKIYLPWKLLFNKLKLRRPDYVRAVSPRAITVPVEIELH